MLTSFTVWSVSKEDLSMCDMDMFAGAPFIWDNVPLSGRCLEAGHSWDCLQYVCVYSEDSPLGKLGSIVWIMLVQD